MHLKRSVRMGLVVVLITVGLVADTGWASASRHGPANENGVLLSGPSSMEPRSPEAEYVRLRPGDIVSARVAIRRACRRFYSYGTQAEIDRECGRGRIGWRSDCYADRPSRFIPRNGGCAYLRGYLAVWFLPAYPTRPVYPPHIFRVGQSTWVIQPESD